MISKVYFRVKKSCWISKLREIIFMSCFLISIFDTQNEKDFLNHYTSFWRVTIFEKLFWKVVYSLSVFGILNKIKIFHLLDSNKVFFFIFLIWLIIKLISRAIFTFFLNPYIFISLPEIVKLFFWFFLIFVILMSYIFLYVNVWKRLLWQSQLQLSIIYSILWLSGLLNASSSTMVNQFSFVISFCRAWKYGSNSTENSFYGPFTLI